MNNRETPLTIPLACDAGLSIHTAVNRILAQSTELKGGFEKAERERKIARQQ